jgi:tRNA 2-thiocytidine biosynthesis protein TtcA
MNRNVTNSDVPSLADLPPLAEAAMLGRVGAPVMVQALLPDGSKPKSSPRRSVPDNPIKLEKKIAYAVTKAVRQYNMIEDGDRVMVCMSGGKDSYALLHFLQRAQKHAHVNFEILAVHLDQGHPGFPIDVLRGYLETCGSPFEIVEQNTYDIVLEKLKPGSTTCSLCSRLRRGILYDRAKKFGCTKVALGHHRDDILATFLLNLFFVGQLKAMPATLRADDGVNVLIRPLSYVPEDWIVAFAKIKQWPLIPCSLCSKQPDLKRSQMEGLLDQIDGVYPGALESALHALRSVHPRFLLDNELYNFETGAGPVDRDADAFA